jgi:hypothetical protein
MKPTLFLPGLLLAMTAAPALAGAIALDDFKSIERGVVEASYFCGGNTTGPADAVVAYELSPMSEPRARFTRAVVKGVQADAGTLGKLNAAVAGRGIEGLSVNCSSTDVRIVAVLYNPESSELEYLVIIKRKDGPLEVSGE